MAKNRDELNTVSSMIDKNVLWWHIKKYFIFLSIFFSKSKTLEIIAYFEALTIIIGEMKC